VEDIHKVAGGEMRQRCASMTNVRTSMPESYGITVALSKLQRQDSGLAPDSISITSATPPPYVSPPSYNTACQRNSLSGSTKSLNLEPDRYIRAKPPTGYASLPRSRSSFLAESFMLATNPDMRRISSSPGTHLLEK
jgi:hypothetical protein